MLEMFTADTKKNENSLLKMITAVASAKAASFVKSSTSTRNAGKKFSNTSDFKQVLNRLKVDFDKKYNNPKASSEAGLDEYDVLKTLGTGAFGVVVSIQL